MKLIKVTLHKSFLFCCLVFFFESPAQVLPKKNYPQGYFAYPVGAKIGLAANFGELRPNHYHMGLDLKTDQKQNVHVYAAAEGYISHIKIDQSGFGRAIYINHPNGLTTLYAHLNDFYPALEKYVKEQQYKLESWEIFLDIPPGMFPVKKMQFIAYSGSTGGSQGPHVHFEIRDTKTDKVLNPLLFGFPVADDVPPLILRLAVYDRSVSTYSSSPKLFPLRKINGVYIPSLPVININTDKVSFGISAIDRLTGSFNTDGIYEAILYNNSMPVVGFQLDSISYDETRYVNANIDYKLRISGGPFVQHLSRLPGYPEGVYKDINGDGVSNLKPDSLNEIKIEVKDAYGNTSVVQFKIKTILKNIESKQAQPFSLSSKELYPGIVNIIDNDELQIIIGQNDLYDSVQFNYYNKPSFLPQSISSIHVVQSPLVPVNGYFTIRVKPNKILEPEDTGRVIMQRTGAGKTEVAKAVQQGEWFTSHFRNFGNFQLLIDKTPPVITAIGIKENSNLSRASQIIFFATDNNNEIKNFRAKLDGKWLRFTNDKGKAFIYKFDEKCTPGNHELKVSVQDEAGNTSIKIFHFIR